MLRCNRRRHEDAFGTTAILRQTSRRFATHQEPIYIISDFNVRLQRLVDPNADQCHLLVDCYVLKLKATGQTHQLGGTLDAVITQATTGCML